MSSVIMVMLRMSVTTVMMMIMIMMMMMMMTMTLPTPQARLGLSRLSDGGASEEESLLDDAIADLKSALAADPNNADVK
jgi:hypothetical protein